MKRRAGVKAAGLVAQAAAMSERRSDPASFWCHDCRAWTDVFDDGDAFCCDGCGAQYLCDDCGEPIDRDGYCPREGCRQSRVPR